LPKPTVAIVGAGPAGLMAAEVLSAAGAGVTVYERMPSVGRKFLMAGRGGLNLTHSEPFEPFVARYGGAAAALRPLLEAFPPRALVDWAEGLGQATFVGSSGRVFPRAMKASPLLRAWLRRLRDQGVEVRTGAAWRGFGPDGALRIAAADGGERLIRPDASILALGGASWPRLGSDGGWAAILAAAGVEIAPFRPANGGFLADWSTPFADRFAGSPLKTIALAFDGQSVRGEMMITRRGIEGGAVYALGARLRDAIAVDGEAVLHVDIRPDLTEAALTERLVKPRGGGSLSNHLRKAGLTPLAINLLREGAGEGLPADPVALARRIKAVPIRLTGSAPMERAISTAGGVRFDAMNDRLMLKTLPGVFVAGEMLDWEAPTGGYLLQACFATGATAARGVLERLGVQSSSTISTSPPATVATSPTPLPISARARGET
jgi:uncharacterized flavoprotein (TIGR03862 family)